MQIKAMVRYHSTPPKIAIITIFKNQKITNVGKVVEELEPPYVAGRNVTWHSHCGKHSGSSTKD